MKHNAPSRTLFALTGLGLALASSQAFAGLSIYTSPNTGYDVSANGQWAALAAAGGSGGTTVSLWSAATNSLTDIGGLAGTGGGVLVSADGSVVAASTKDPVSGFFATSTYQTSTGVWTVQPILGGSSGGATSVTWALSATGRYVGGSAYSGSVSRGFVTDTLTGTITDMGATQARVQGISPDASTLIGYYTSGQTGSMWKRNADGTYTQTTLKSPDSPTTSLGSTIGMSTDGKWAVGVSGVSGNPYRLNTDTGQIQFFDKLPNSYAAAPLYKANASPSSISLDGNTIVGIYAKQGVTLDGSYGFIWKADGTTTGNKLGGTVMTFDDYLTGFGIDTTNHYNFLSVVGMSDDATVFTGIALDNFTGGKVSFVVSIPSAVPEPSQVLMFAAGLAALAGLGRRRKHEG